MKMDLTFADQFDAAPAEARADVPSLYYPGCATYEGQDGIAFELRPLGNPSWIGVFAPAPLPVRSEPSLTAHPDGIRFGVINQGAGYLVSSRNPRSWSEIPVAGIASVTVSNTLPLVIYSGLTDIAAYGTRGLAWHVENLSWDGIQIEAIDGRYLRGFSWHAPSGRWVRFDVDLRSGDVFRDVR